MTMFALTLARSVQDEGNMGYVSCAVNAVSHKSLAIIASYTHLGCVHIQVNEHEIEVVEARWRLDDASRWMRRL